MTKNVVSALFQSPSAVAQSINHSIFMKQYLLKILSPKSVFNDLHLAVSHQNSAKSRLKFVQMSYIKLHTQSTFPDKLLHCSAHKVSDSYRAQLTHLSSLNQLPQRSGRQYITLQHPSHLCQKILSSSSKNSFESSVGVHCPNIVNRITATGVYLRH